MKKLLIAIIIGVTFNCSSSSIKDQISKGEDMVCEEENPRDCKFQFENY
jgi:hypothetical protein